MQHLYDRLALVAFLCLLPMKAWAGVPSESMIQFPPNFFNQFMKGITPALSEYFAQVQFPAEGTSACAEVLLNGGAWFSSVSIPHNVTTVTGTKNLVTLSTPGVVVSGLDGGTSWSSMIESSVSGAWSTCFQLCFGSSPFTATTSFASVIQFNSAAGSPITATVQSANMAHDGSWTLETLNNVCISSQAVFEQQFNAGVSSALASSEAATSALVEKYLNGILANSTTSGLTVSDFDADTSTLSLSTVAGLPAPTQFPVAPSVTVDLAMTAQLAAAVVPLAAKASCVVRSACGSASTSGSTQFEYSQCSACLQALDSQVYLAFTASADVQSLQQQQLQKHTTVPRVHRTAIPGFRRDAKTALPTPPELPAVGTTVNYLTTTILTQTMATVGAKAAALLASVTYPSVIAGLLPHAQKYCGLQHQGFAWSNVPSSLDIVARTITTLSNATLVVVEFPQLSSITGSGAFAIECSVEMPLGTPFNDAASGNFTVSMTPPNSQFLVTVLITPTTASVFEFPDLSFTSTVTYKNPEKGFVFDAYTQDLFVGTIGTDVTSSTQAILSVDMPVLWLSALDGLLRSYNTTVAVSSAQQGEAWALTLLSSPSAGTTLPPLDSVVPEALQQQGTNTAALQAVATPPPFSFLPSCATRPTCSAVGTLHGPLNNSAQMTNCESCVALVDGNSMVALGATYDLILIPREIGLVSDPQPTPQLPLRALKPELAPTRRSKRRARKLHKKSTEPVNSTSSTLYVGVGILSEVTAQSGPSVEASLQQYVHYGPQAMTLPHMPICLMSHSNLSWTNIAVVTPTVTSIQSDTQNDITVTVALRGLPTSLTSNTLAFNTQCSAELGLPMPWMQSQVGTTGVTLTFEDVPQLVLSIATDFASGTAVVTSRSMTNFSVQAKYAYADETGFTMDPYVNHYFTNVLVREVASDLYAYVQATVWAEVSASLNDIVSSAFSVSCPVQQFKGTHLVMTAGAICNQSSFPAPPLNLAADSFHYCVNAGALPPPNMAPAGNHSAAQALSTCTGLVPLGQPVSGVVTMATCATMGVEYDDQLFVAVTGAMPYSSA